MDGCSVKVPRLNGGRLGVLATRSPHRPCPIGLSVAKIDRVVGPHLYLSGVDIVDGSPVLDVKPYLAYCDAVPGTSAPPWVEASGAADPLLLADVSFAAGVEEALDSLWEKMGKRSLYDSPKELLALVAQVLSRDIRSVHQRQLPHGAARPGSAPGETRGGDKEEAEGEPGAEGRGESAAGEAFLDRRKGSGSSAVDGRIDSAEGKGFVEAGELRTGDDGRTENGVRPEVSLTGSDGNEDCMQLESGSRQCLGRQPGASENGGVTYHLKVEGVNFSYNVDRNGCVYVNGADLSP